MYAFSAGLQSSAQLLGTTNRRIVATAVWCVLFLLFWVYLHFSKPSWTGFGGLPQKLTRPKLRHWLYLGGVLVFTWAPSVPWLMPNSQLEQSTVLEIQREVGVLGEKARMADFLYSQMKDGEDSMEEYLKLPAKVRLLVPPPTPYAGLAEHLQTDLPRFGSTVSTRAAELEAAGGRLKSRARIYRRFEEIEDKEREVEVGFRLWWEPYVKYREWSTPIGPYRRAFQYLILGVHLRTLRELEPDLRSIGISTPAIPADLAVTKDPVFDADQKRFEKGDSPNLQESDFVPRERHCCVPTPLR